MREEINSKKQITQIYLIMFSLILPQLFADFFQKNITDYQKACILVFSAYFVLNLLMYYMELTETKDLTEFKRDSVNDSAIHSSIAFGFVTTIFVSLSAYQTGFNMPTDLSLDIIHYARHFMFLFASTVFIIAFANTLFIKTNKEIPVDAVANEIIRLRSNPYMNMIRKKIGMTVDIRYLVYILLIYSIAAYTSKSCVPSP